MFAFIMGLSFLLAVACFGVAVAVPHKKLLQQRLLIAAIVLVLISGVTSAIFVFNN